MEIRDILKKVKDGEMEINEALSLIEEGDEESRQVKVKKLKKEDIKKIIEKKTQEMRVSQTEEIAVPGDSMSLVLRLENGLYDISEGDTLSIDGLCIKSYDKNSNTLVLKNSKSCDVIIPYGIKDLKIFVKNSSVDLDIENREFVLIQVDRSNVEGEIKSKKFEISNSLGNIEMEIMGAEEGVVNNRLGNVELELHGKFNFEVSNNLGSVEIDESLKDKTGKTIKIKNALGSVEII